MASPKGRENLHHPALAIGPHRKPHDQEIDHRRTRTAPPRQGRPPSKGSIAKNANRKKVAYIAIIRKNSAMGEIHHVHQTEDQCEPDGDEAVERPMSRPEPGSG